MDREEITAENQSPAAHEISKKLWFYALSAGFLGGFIAHWCYSLFIRGITPQFWSVFEKAFFSTFHVAVTFWFLSVFSKRQARDKGQNSQK